jgi:hypothetical protein
VVGRGHSEIPPHSAFLGGLDSFADHDQALLLAAPGDSELSAGSLSAVELSNGVAAHLGTADEAAGDPRYVGAFVSVPGPQADHPPPGGYLGAPDSRVELRDLGRPTAVLATAGQLQSDLGRDPATPVHLSVFPDPSGDSLAIVVNPPDQGGGNAGMVVVDRQGRVISVIEPGPGPIEYSWPSWSPDGSSMAFVTLGDSGTAITTWVRSGRLLERRASEGGADFGYCLWSPDGSAILCPAYEPAGTTWEIGSARSGGLYSVGSVGTVGDPILWIPAAGGRRPD